MQWGNSKIPFHACINIRIGENHASRNIYFFIKALNTSTQKIFACSDMTFIRRLLKDYYASFLLTEGLVKFRVKPSAACRTFGILPESDVKISYNYFSLLLQGLPIPSDHYHVPIGMHPLQYYLKLDKNEYTLPRKRALFFSGNLKPKFYSRFDSPGLFNMPGRLTLFEALKVAPLPLVLNPEVQKLTTQNWDGQVIICDSDCCKVPHEDWRRILAGMNFFLCFPGQVIPFCHNIYEAMSVGTIPILHKNYAALFSPPLLDGKHCYTFTDAQHFIEVCQKCLALPDEQLAPMQNNVLEYYLKHLTLEAVGKKVMDAKLRVIYLQGEQYSLQILNHKKEAINK